MEQGHSLAGTTGTRRLLRALFLLGGFVVVWWCLATGTAQAADGPHHEEPHRDLGSVTKALGASVDRAVHQSTHQTRRTVEHVTHRSEPVRRTVAKLTPTLRHQSTSATSAGVTADDTRAATPTKAPVRGTLETVVKAVDADPATQLVASTAGTLLTVVDDTVTATATPVLEHTRGILAQATAGTPLAPVLETLPSASSASTVLAESIGQHAAAQQAAAPFAAASSSTSTASATDDSATTHGPDQVLPSSPIGQGPSDQSPGTHAAAALSAQSGSGAGGLPGLLASAFGIVPPAAQDLISTHVDRFPAGPAYRPTCSPD
jgi:hypothetical protein